MIRFKNQDEFLEDLSVPGTLVTGTHVKTLLVPFACQLKAIYAKLGVAGITGTTTVEIMKNGTTIFSTGTKLSNASTSQAFTYGALTTNPTNFVKGDIIRVDITAVQSGTAPIDLNLLLTLKRLRSGSVVGTMETDTIGLSAE